MSDITRAPLRPLGTKAGTVSARDARAYASDLVDTALSGPGVYHADGGYIDELDRIRRLGEAVRLLYGLQSRTSNVDGRKAIAGSIEDVRVLAKNIGNTVMDYQFKYPYEKVPRTKFPEWRRLKKQPGHENIILDERIRDHLLRGIPRKI